MQHYEKPECKYNPIFTVDEEKLCETSEDDIGKQMKGHLTIPTSDLLPDQESKIHWKDKETNGIEVVLLDDDFSDAIDGSGFVYNMPIKLKPWEAEEYIDKFFQDDN